jgi:hypothetical protein
VSLHCWSHPSVPRAHSSISVSKGGGYVALSFTEQIPQAARSSLLVQQWVEQWVE